MISILEGSGNIFDKTRLSGLWMNITPRDSVHPKMISEGKYPGDAPMGRLYEFLQIHLNAEYQSSWWAKDRLSKTSLRTGRENGILKKNRTDLISVIQFLSFYHS